LTSRRLLTLRLVALAAMLLALVVVPAYAVEMEDVARDAVDHAGLLPADVAMLEQADFRWRHLQTHHFVVHYERKTFATRVARMGEQFYDAISGDLPALQDRMDPRRSHIFIFRKPRDWQTVVANTPGLEPWAASFVRGQAMYLQEIGRGKADKMSMLAHEMTHLVVNRFLTVRLPLWLNEGLAEYYGEFAYRRARGLTHRERNVFKALRDRTPLADLIAATDYPADPAEVARFYATAKQLVGWMLWKLPREKWTAFLTRIMAGERATAALLDTYGWTDIDDLATEFADFNR
jgi:hypothetical protein